MKKNSKPLLGLEHIYTIDTDGNIFDIERNKFIKKYERKTGYFGLTLRGIRGNERIKLLHRLLAINFVPNPDNLPCVNHIDGNKRNNNIENLEWCTYSQNNQHAFDTGLKRACDRYYPIREKHPNSKINQAVAEMMRIVKQKDKMFNKDIANTFNVSIGLVAAVLYKKTWSYAQPR